MIYAIIGFFAGIISGLGIGGGTILIPSLVFILGIKQQVAQSVNLISFIPIAIIALIVHCRNKNVVFKLTLIIVGFGIVGAIIGSKVAVIMPAEILKKLFGFFLFAMGIYELVHKGKSKKG